MKQINFGVAGFYQIFIKDKNGVTHKKAEGKNLILNQGLNRWFSAPTSTIMNRCRVGTGTSTPVVTQTQLDNVIATTSSRTINSGSSGGIPDWYYFYQCTYTFPLGGVVGNISELGLDDNTNLMTRALIKDELGNPTTITVTAEEQLIVIYELRKYSPTGDSNLTLTLNFNGTPTDFDSVIRAANVSNITFSPWDPNEPLSAATGTNFVTAFETQTLGATTSTPAGSGLSGTLNAAGAYVNETFYRDYTADFSLTQGNFTNGIGSIALFGSAIARHIFQLNFTPRILKNADRLLSIPVRLSWARI